MVVTSSSPNYLFRYTYGTFSESSNALLTEIMDNFGVELLCSVYLHICRCQPGYRTQTPSVMGHRRRTHRRSTPEHAWPAVRKREDGSRRRGARLSRYADLPGFRHAGTASGCRLPVACAPWSACAACPGCYPAPCNPGGPCVSRA